MPRKMALACVSAVAVALVAAPSAVAVTIVKQFAAIPGGPPLYFVEGVAYGNGCLYYSNSESLFELDPNTGAEIRRADVPGYINDLEWVNGELWAARVTPPSIVRFDPANFNELGSFDTSAAGIPEGVAFDGNVVLFSVDGTPPMVYELDITTGSVGNPRTSVASDPEAMAYGAGALWEAGKDEATIYKVSRATGQVIASFGVPSPDIHGMGWDGQYLWATSWQNQQIYQFDVSDVNANPTLSWVGTAGYESDGVDPDSGNSTTYFDFRVLYTDLDNDPPSSVLLYVQRDGIWMPGTPFAMQNLGDTKYDDGAAYSYRMKLPAGSTYRYYFAAANSYGDASGPPTALRSGPIVSDLPPTLAWVGTPGYVSDGVEPDVAQPNSTPIQFQVLYTGVVAAQYVRVHILRDGAPIPNSPFAMTTTDNTPHDGAVYTLERTLPRSRAYSYYFEASDGQRSATGPPTSVTPGPIVGNRAPVLDWSGAPGLETDGVDPDVGSPEQLFRLEVLYRDADNDWPTTILARIAQGGTEIASSPIALTRVPGTKPRTGAIYRGAASLVRGKNYTYWFEANDGYTAAVGPATAPQAGPVVNAAPYLEWFSRAGWVADGVRPDEAVGRTSCEFRVVYRDLDGDVPATMAVEIRRYQTPLSRSPFIMHLRSGKDATEGLTYARSVWLGPGTYWYRFVATDGYSDARGVPTQWKKGPIIRRATTSAQITSLTANQAGTAVQVTFSLSAAAEVQAQVVNIAGRPVRMLAPRNCDSGPNVLVWDGLNSAGLPAPSGLYIITLVARDDNGVESRAIGRVYLRR